MNKKSANSMRRLILIAFLLLPVIWCVWTVYAALSILGPWDRPQFESKDWSFLEIRYWLVQGYHDEIPRDFAIDGNDLAELKQLFTTKDSVGVSTPCPGFLYLHLSNGQMWKIQFGTAKSLKFCLGSNTYYAYGVTLSDTKFHKKLREFCLRNEQKYTPSARIENISICTNRQICNYSELLDIKPRFIGEFIMIGQRGEFSEVVVPVICQEDLNNVPTSSNER